MAPEVATRSEIVSRDREEGDAGGGGGERVGRERGERRERE